MSSHITNDIANNINLPQIIGITGKKFNGKDTLGNYFVEKYGYKRLAFADALKNACGSIFGFTYDQLHGNKKEEIDQYWKVSPRTIFQYVGTDLFRNQISNVVPNIGKDIWLKVIEKQILDELKINPLARFVVTDVRFANECEFIKNLGGTTIRIKRSMTENTDTHQSENEIDNLNVDLEILNNDTIESLFKNIDELLILNNV